VHHISGVSRATVATLYRRASLYVSASALEAFPLTPYEAMSFGVPCVLSDIPTHREVAGDAAIYFGLGDAESLSYALRNAADNRAALVERMRKLRLPTWPENVRRLEAEFGRLLQEAHR
jgi:glycosyltransferase involved in cell wall biosynthesis